MIQRIGSIGRKTFLIVTFIVAVCLVAKAQIVKTESFDNNFAGTTFPNSELPFGWTQGKIIPSTDFNNYWDRVNTGILPTCGVHNGAGMMRFRSNYITNAGEQGYLISRPYDLSARPAGTSSNVRFWLFREATSGNDQLQVMVNNAASITGASLALPDTAGLFATIPRPCGSAPMQACGTWQLWGFQIPANTWSINNLYVIIKVQDAGAAGANVYLDDFSIDTYPSAQLFNSMGLDFQNQANITSVVPTSNNWIIGCRITVTNEGSQCGALGAFTFTHNGSTDPGWDIANSGTGGVKLWWTGGTNVFSTSNAIQVGAYSGAAFPVPNFTIIPTIPAPYNGLLNGNNYFWLTYDIAFLSSSGHFVDADFISANLGSCGTQICGGFGCSLPGARMLGFTGCVPGYMFGTVCIWGTYVTNDYIKHVICAGDPASPPGINNDHNDQGPNYPGSGMGDPCVPAGGCQGGPCPFSAHPPDYENFSTAPVPALCSGGGLSTRTAVFVSTAVSPPTYNISVQCGTWYGSNFIGAWIDFNHDGAFSDNMWTIPGGEKIFQSTAMNALTWQNGNFQVPVTGYYGSTILRVREQYGTPNITACVVGYYGEVEDYTVVIRPDCSPQYAGWKIWLGYTDDWNLNSNWCGGVPTINDNALIGGQGAASFNRGAGTYHPVIRSGVNATTKKLVLLNDTVEINAPAPGSLRISDSLSIGVSTTPNTSALIVDSSHSAQAIVSNGVNVNPAFLPFRASFREQKMQLMYKTSELTALGMQNGDIIDQVTIPIRQRGSTMAYPASIKMYYSNNNAAYPNFITVGFTSPPPVAPTTCTAFQQTIPVNVFSGTIDFTGIPLNGNGNGTVNLTTPFTFNTSGNYPLIVEICYSIPAGAGANDLTWQTQTTGFRSVLLLANLGAYSVPACSWNNTAPNGTTLTQRQVSDLRPNLTFIYHRLYTVYPINMETNGAATAQWVNYGNFIPANSVVTFMGSAAQNIDGINNTTFDELKINHTGAGFTRQVKPITVNDRLWLQNGRLILNQQTLTIKNGTAAGITQLAPNTGYLYSEDLPPNYGKVNWQIGTNTGPHVFPFVSSNSNTPIPFTYTATSGSSDITLGTYYPSANPPALLPLPAGVTTINSYNNPNVSDAPNMVKRFWILTNPSAATADLTFSWANTSEAPANGAAPLLVSQRWNGVPTAWAGPTIGQMNPTLTTVVAPGISNFNSVWALTRQPEPLPVSLLEFTAKAEKDHVRLDWVMTSEKDVDKYTVERTPDAFNYTWIADVESHGHGSTLMKYTAYDPDPLPGLQYYHLKQIDNNGEEILSKLVPVTFGQTTLFEIITIINYADGSFDILFNYNSDLPYSYKLVDMVGNIVSVKENIKSVKGTNSIHIKNLPASAVYFITVNNQIETAGKKVFKY